MFEESSAEMPDQQSYGEYPSRYAAGVATRRLVVVLLLVPAAGMEVDDESPRSHLLKACHNPVVLKAGYPASSSRTRSSRSSMPKKEATDRFLKYVASKWFIPKAFFNEEQIEKLSGVYYPFWIYDCEVEGGIEGHAKNIRVWRGGMYEYTETSTYAFERGGKVHVQNITRNALKKSDRNLIDAVRPFRIEQAQSFAMPYLQGFVAQKRDVETQEVSQELQASARKYAQMAMEQTVNGYTSASTDRSSLHPVKEKWQYLLLPVWVLTYGASNGDRYYYAMNGQTGEIKGKSFPSITENCRRRPQWSEASSGYCACWRRTLFCKEAAMIRDKLICRVLACTLLQLRCFHFPRVLTSGTVRTGALQVSRTELMC